MGVEVLERGEDPCVRREGAPVSAHASPLASCLWTTANASRRHRGCVTRLGIRCVGEAESAVVRMGRAATSDHAQGRGCSAGHTCCLFDWEEDRGR